MPSSLSQIGLAAVRGAQDTDVHAFINEIQRGQHSVMPWGRYSRSQNPRNWRAPAGIHADGRCADELWMRLFTFFTYSGCTRLAIASQRIQFQKLGRPVHFVQRGRHTGQSHLVQFSQQGVKKSSFPVSITCHLLV
jgi:hypothetical protein